MRSALAGGSGDGDCYTGPGHKLLGIDGGRGCGVCGEREEIVIYTSKRIKNYQSAHNGQLFIFIN